VVSRNTMLTSAGPVMPRRACTARPGTARRQPVRHVHTPHCLAKKHHAALRPGRAPGGSRSTVRSRVRPRASGPWNRGRRLLPRSCADVRRADARRCTVRAEGRVRWPGSSGSSSH
jgi:hypothetical protein